MKIVESTQSKADKMFLDTTNIENIFKIRNKNGNKLVKGYIRRVLVGTPEKPLYRCYVIQPVNDGWNSDPNEPIVDIDLLGSCNTKTFATDAVRMFVAWKEIQEAKGKPREVKVASAGEGATAIVF